MNSEVQIFSFEDNQVRTIELEGEPWFVGKDVVHILGYKNGSRDINVHVHEEDRQIIKSTETVLLDIPSRGLTIINESGLYSLIEENVRKLVSLDMSQARKSDLSGVFLFFSVFLNLRLQVKFFCGRINLRKTQGGELKSGKSP